MQNQDLRPNKTDKTTPGLGRKFKWASELSATAKPSYPFDPRQLNGETVCRNDLVENCEMNPFQMTTSKAPSSGGSVKAPAGNHLAVLVGVFDMGTQRNEFQGKETKQRRAFFVWELVGEKIAGTTKNHVIGIDLTLSMNENSKLRKWVEARTCKQFPDGASFDVSSELGQACLLNVIKKGDWPKIEGVTAVPKGMSVLAPICLPTSISLDEFKAGKVIPEWCPWLYGSHLADHIRACIEIGGSKPVPSKKPSTASGAVESGSESSEDPIPF